MATSPNNIYQIPDTPYNPGPTVFTQELAALTKHETTPGHPPLPEIQVNPEYTPKVQFLVDLSHQHAKEQKRALEKNRLAQVATSPASKLAYRLMGHGRERALPATLREMIDLESTYRVAEIPASPEADDSTAMGAAPSSPVSRAFYHDTRLYYSPEELDEREWRDKPNGAIEWVYVERGQKPSETLFYRYQVLPTEVIKIIEPYDERGMPLPTYWQTLQGKALDNFLRTAHRHYTMISEGIYGNQVHHFDESIRKASEALLHQQVKTGQEAVRQTVTPESTNEKIREAQEAEIAYTDTVLVELQEEEELEAVTGHRYEDVVAYTERRAQEELEKWNKSDFDLIA